MPALDLDILNEEAARAVEDLARERFEEHGWFLVRIGKAPKRAIIFRTNTPFHKLTVNLTESVVAENGQSWANLLSDQRRRVLQQLARFRTLHQFM
jgi:hypothetical protein